MTRLSSAQPLIGELPTLDLPFCRDEVEGGGRVLIARRRLEPGLAARARALASDLDVGAREVALAAIAAVVYRYNRQPQLLLGVARAGRGELDPLLLDASDDPTLRDWIGRFATELAARADGEEPTEAGGLARSLGVDAATARAHLARCALATGGADPRAAAVAFAVEEDGEEVALVAHGVPGQVIEERLQAFFDHVGELLASGASDPESALASLELLPAAERAKLAAWNATETSYRGKATLVDLFEDCVQANPGATALLYGDDELTYAELNERSNRLARWLVEIGVQRDTLVGVLMERSIEMLVSIYAILKAGGAYVPLDPDVPDERLEFMAEEAELVAVLTQARLAERAPAQAEVCAVDSDWHRLEAYDADDLQLEIDPKAAAYVIYTSGSTGRPKGVLNEHRGIVNRLLWMQEEYGLDGSDCVLQKTPFSFDVSVWELFWPLQTGARLAIAAPDGHRDPGYLAREIDERGVTTIHFVPSMLRLFLDDARAASCTGLERVICSGEALTFDLQQRFFEVFPGEVELHNLYGPTEAAVDVTYWACDRADTSGVVPIGRPVANTQIHIVDERLRHVPIGVAGELHIGGVQVARGYVSRPELTAERFIDDPFSAGRLYRTGDLARWRTDGNLEFLGRTDHQVKIRGNRVELGEIEAVLLQHDRVATAAVTTHETKSGSLQLIAHFTAPDLPAPGPDVLRAFLDERLPSYMVPNAFVAHEELTLTTSGKIDRKSLDAALEAQRAQKKGSVAPRDVVEQLLADIWSDVLGRDDIGVDERFFELGGDSIQAAGVVSRVQQELDEFVYVITAFTAPTIAEYARLLRRDYPEAIARRFGESAEQAMSGPERPFAEKLAELRGAVPSFAPFPCWRQGSASPRTIFVLSPPRSGTSLLRVMLAGHPGLFAGSELQLLHFDTLEQRRRAFDGPFSLWLEGTIRALMELHAVDATEAGTLMEGYEADGLSAKDLYRVLHEASGGRTLVDKSPSYALDRGALENAEAGIDDAFYIHLLRDPHEMAHSFASYHMDQVLFLEDHGLRGVELGELVWLESHTITLEFLTNVPPERQVRLRFEDLVSAPKAELERVAAAAEIEFHPGLLTPYEGLERKMVDGLREGSTPMGDTRLLEHRRIDPAVARKWREKQPLNVLAPETWELAGQFGYEPPDGASSFSKPTRRRHAARQRRRRVSRS